MKGRNICSSVNFSVGYVVDKPIHRFKDLFESLSYVRSIEWRQRFVERCATESNVWIYYLHEYRLRGWRGARTATENSVWIYMFI